MRIKCGWQCWALSDVDASVCLWLILHEDKVWVAGALITTCHIWAPQRWVAHNKALYRSMVTLLMLVVWPGHLAQDCFHRPGDKAYELLEDVDLVMASSSTNVSSDTDVIHKKKVVHWEGCVGSCWLCSLILMLWFFYSAFDRGAEYCDDRVCLCVCVLVCLWLELHIRSSANFLCMLPMAVAWSSSGSIVICYVLLVLWMTSYLLRSKVAQHCRPAEVQCTRSLGLGYKLCTNFVPVAGQRTHRTTFRSLKVTSQVAVLGAESVVYDCLVISCITSSESVS